MNHQQTSLGDDGKLLSCSVKGKGPTHFQEIKTCKEALTLSTTILEYEKNMELDHPPKESDLKVVKFGGGIPKCLISTMHYPG